MKWYVVQTHSWAEAVAEKNLRKQGFGVYFPSVGVQRVVRGVVVEEQQPLFAGYGFAELDLEDISGRWRKVHATRGIAHVLPAGVEEPQALPAGFVAELRRRVEAGEFVEGRGDDWLAGLAEGAPVKVTSGEFVGLSTTFLKKERGRVWLLLRMFGRENQIKVAQHQIEAVA